jgi:hypothetical protein
MVEFAFLQRTIKNTANIFKDEEALIKKFDELMYQEQNEASFRVYADMLLYLRKRVVELDKHLESKHEGIQQCLVDVNHCIQFVNAEINENLKSKGSD